MNSEEQQQSLYYFYVFLHQNNNQYAFKREKTIAKNYDNDDKSTRYCYTCTM